MSLENKIVVVLGGSTGIGLATAQAACAEGAQVIITGRSKQKLQAACAELGNAASSTVLDVTDEAGTRTFFESLDHIDHVFITAGAAIGDHHLLPSSGELRPSMETRFWGALYAAKYSAAKIVSGGSIIFMSGTAARRPLEGAAVTTASTGAIEAFARALAIDLAPIRVNVIRPGWVDTPFLDEILGAQRDETLAAAAEKLPVKRIGRPDEIADAVLFLMKNEYVTGIALTVDGGGLLV